MQENHLNEYSVEGSQNIINNIISDNLGNITINFAENLHISDGLNIVGNKIVDNEGDVIINLYSNPDYKKIYDNYIDLRNQLEVIPAQEKKRRLQISKKINYAEKEKKDVENGILKLIAAFGKTTDNETIDTVKKMFLLGDTDEAENLLFNKEFDNQIRQRLRITESIKIVMDENKKYAEICLFRALMNEYKYKGDERIEITCNHFKESITLYENDENCFYYAHFLQKCYFYEEAEIYYTKILNKYKATTHPLNVANWLLNLSSLYLNYKQDDKYALNFSLEAFEIYQRLNNRKGIFASLNSLSFIYLESNNFEGSKQIGTIVLDLIDSAIIHEEEDTLIPLYSALSNLAASYSFEHNFSQAENLYGKIFKLTDWENSENEVNSRILEIWCNILQNLGVLYSMKGDYLKAEELQLKVLSIRGSLVDENPYQHHLHMVQH